MGVVIPFEESSAEAGIARLSGLVAGDLERVNTTILERTGSDVTMIPEVANHLISSGGKRLRPMLTLATAGLCDYPGEGHIKLAAVRRIHAHRHAAPRRCRGRERHAARQARGAHAVGQRGERARRRLPARPGLQDDGRGRLAAMPRRALHRRRRHRRRRGDAALRRQGHADDRGRLSRRHPRQDGGPVRRRLRGRPHSRRRGPRPRSPPAAAMA